jgi:hypothetical protein
METKRPATMGVAGVDTTDGAEDGRAVTDMSTPAAEAVGVMVEEVLVVATVVAMAVVTAEMEAVVAEEEEEEEEMAAAAEEEEGAELGQTTDTIFWQRCI